MTEALVTVGPAPAACEPRWLSPLETDAWMGVATIAVQLTGVLDAQLQRDSGIGFFE